MKKSIKLAVVALLSVIMLVFNMSACAVSEDVEGIIPLTTEEQPIKEQPVEAIPTETPSVKEQPVEEEQPAEEPLVTELPATKQPATKPPATELPATEPPVEEVSVTVNSLSTSSIRLNLYAQEDISSTILYVFTATDKVVVLDQSDDWLSVDFNGLQGYIALFEPLVAQGHAPIEKPAAEEGPDATETAVAGQEPTATEEPAKLDLSIESDTEETAATSQVPLTAEEPAESGLTAEPAAEEDTAADQVPELTEDPVALDLTVEPDAVPANISVTIRAETPSVLHYGDVITLAGTLGGEKEPNYTLQWQQRDQGGAWRDLEGENKLQYSFILTKQNEHSEWKLDVRIN